AQLDHYLQSYPGQFDALYFKGRALASLGRLDEARQSLDRSIANWPAVPVFSVYFGDTDVRLAIGHQVLADIAMRQGRPADALDHLERAAKIKPEMAPKQHFVIGVALGRLERWPDAERHLQTAVELTPGDATSRGYLAYAFARQA